MRSIICSSDAELLVWGANSGRVVLEVGFWHLYVVRATNLAVPAGRAKSETHLHGLSECNYVLPAENVACAREAPLEVSK